VLFYEPFFVYFVLPVFCALFLAVNHFASAKKWMLLISSAALYSWGEPRFVGILIVSTLIDFWLVRFMYEARSKRLRYAICAVGVVGNLAVLGVYKYFDFVATNLNLLLSPMTDWRISLLRVALPIGVSFVVFEKITYLVDTHRGVSKPAPCFLDYALFVFFFPKLLAGPILKYHEMQAQIATPAPAGFADAAEGMVRFARGLVKKLLIADPIGTLADSIFGIQPSQLDPMHAALGALAFTLQVYFDFSAYADMALGLARMLGFRLKENFQMPYIAQSVTEFWQRWNISLTTWFRDYLYLSFGQHRRGPFRKYLNIWTWIIFLACGLWHGANWTFVAWGAYYAFFLTLDRLFLLKWLRASGPLVATAVTFAILNLGSVFFRSPTISHLGSYMVALVDWSRQRVSIEVSGEVQLAMVVALFLSFLPGTPVYRPLRIAYENSFVLRFCASLGIILLGLIATARSFALPFQPFIYFRF
jgi:alginate O-acetyltransferase complex protein AlgI